jgi:hypothetical protein
MRQKSPPFALPALRPNRKAKGLHGLFAAFPAACPSLFFPVMVFEPACGAITLNQKTPPGKKQPQAKLHNAPYDTRSQASESISSVPGLQK